MEEIMKENNTDFLYYDNKMEEELFEDELLYSPYMYEPDIDEYIYEVDNVEEFNEQVRICRREAEIDRVFDDLLELIDTEVMLPNEKMDELQETLKDVVFEALYALYGISVYRPMYIRNDAGEDEYTEYPYDKTELKFFNKKEEL